MSGIFRAAGHPHGFDLAAEVAKFRREHPTCQGKGCNRPTTHIVGLDNCTRRIAMCSGCHELYTRATRPESFEAREAEGRRNRLIAQRRALGI